MSGETIDLDALGASLMKLERLPLAQKPLRGELFGDYETREIGDGFDIHDMRPYEPGDDFRDINWQATVNEGQTIVETHLAENAPAFYVASDLPSRRYHNDSAGRSERDLGIGLSMVTTLMARRDGLPTTAIWSNGHKIAYGEEPNFDDVAMMYDFKQAVKLVREADAPFEQPSQKRSFLRRRGSSAEQSIPDPEMFLSKLLSRLGGIAASDSVMTIISDFRDVFDPKDPVNGWYRQLARLGQSHQVMAIELTNKWDHELPEDEVFFRDPTSGNVISIDDVPDGRERYAEQERERSTRIVRCIRQAGVGHLKIDTEVEDWVGHLENQVARLRDAA